MAICFAVNGSVRPLLRHQKSSFTTSSSSVSRKKEQKGPRWTSVTSMPVKLSKPQEVDSSKFPTPAEEEARFKRQGRVVSKDRTYVETKFDLEDKTGVEWLWTATNKSWSSLVDGRKREYLLYNPDLIAEFYDKHPVVVVRRLLSIFLPFGTWGARFTFARRFMKNSDGDLPEDLELELAEALPDTLSEMGITFVKIGQALSQRPDIVGPVISEKLKRLQDSVATFPTEDAFEIMELEYNRPLSEVFDFISPEPVAAASLGQVYKAHIRGAPEGEFVAVKVQRPDINVDASIDLYLTRKMARYFKKKYNMRSNLVGVNDEFGQRLFEETNYVQEAKNCDRFRSMYGEIDGIFVPKTYSEWTTRHVLVMEWIEGTKAPWGADAMNLIDVGIQCTLRQLLDGGFFHADPHPGNLMRTVDGKLAYLDFGMMSEVEPQKRYDLISSVVHLINKDYPELTEDLVNLDFLPEDCDRSTINPLLETAFSKASGGGESMSNLSFNKLASNMATLAYKSPIRLPPYYSLVIRSLTILEGIALSETSDFKIVDESFPYVSKRLLLDNDPILRERLREVLVDKQTGRLRWARLQTMIRESESRQPVGHGTRTYNSRQTQADTATTVEKMAEFLLSDEGEFLRDAIVEDIIDVADSGQLLVQERLSSLSRGLIPQPVDKPNMELLSGASTLLDVFNRELRKSRQLGRLGSSSPLPSQGGNLVLSNALTIQGQVRKASRVVFGGLLERNSTRFLQSVLRVVEGSIDRQVEKAQIVKSEKRQL